ncbi:Protein PIEZO homolog, partial [Durusdinium trenchii]
MSFTALWIHRQYPPLQESSDSSSEAEQESTPPDLRSVSPPRVSPPTDFRRPTVAGEDPTDSGTLETTVSGEPEAEESAPRKPKMHRSSEVAQLSMSNMGGSSSARISRFRVRTGSVPSLDTALMLHSSKSVIAYEWIMEWAKARGRRVGLFASCKAPRDLEHIDPPRLLFPVLRSRENPEEEHEDQEEHRWNQALQWAQVLAYRFLSRQNRLYQRTGHRLGVAQDEQVIECEICTMFVEPNERHWSCGSCNYHICKNCANEIMQGRRPREKLMKLGISLYIAKYFLAFFLLCYALLNNKAILKEEERSFSQSLQENNFSVGTLLLIVAHMTILLSDRIFFKAHYSMRSHATLHIIELVNLGFILAEFVFLHYHTMAILWTSANPREATISLASDWELCIYYLCGMLYITICMMQIKHGLPALGTDSLRPKTIELFSPSSIYTEKLWYYFFLVHYNLPFVDDLRVIVDWTVVPTSLDLWMYWKVEDAHSSFYRSRHLMFVRGQSYYAEERDLLEKFYNGWAILCGVVLVILMPIIVFSPFSPFPNTVLVEHADMALGMTVASSCYGASRQQLCRYVELELFAAPALQIQRYNSSQTQKYLQDNPRVNTDIDIQDIKWPWFSKEAMHASPALVEEVQKIMDEATTGLDIAVVFELRYSLQRSVLGVSSHRRSLCSCAPSCGSFAAFPARVSELCSAGEVCRFCLGDAGDDDELVAPCECRGGQRWVHLAMLGWKRGRQLMEDRRMTHCQVCLAKLTCPALSRHEMMLQFTGQELASLVREQSLISSSQAWSDALFHHLRRVADRRSINNFVHWSRSSYLIYNCGPKQLALSIPDEANREAVLDNLDSAGHLEIQGKQYRLLREGPLAP